MACTGTRSQKFAFWHLRWGELGVASGEKDSKCYSTFLAHLAVGRARGDPWLEGKTPLRTRTAKDTI